MDVSSGEETGITHKMHFYKTVLDLPIYNIHKNFEAFDASELSVEDIINTVFFNCDDKKHAQICAQTYICHRIINKIAEKNSRIAASELQLRAIFYPDPYRRAQTLYEEPTYIIVKNKIAGIAKKILKCPAKILLHRYSGIIKKSSRKGRKKTRAPKPAFDESLRSIVGKFPTLIIPKLSPREIQYHMKPQYHMNFDLKQNSLKMRKNKTMKKTKHEKENIPRNAPIRRSSRLRAKMEVTSNNEEENIFQEDNNLSIITETCLPEDNQHVKTHFQRDKFSDSNETYFQALLEVNSHKDDITSLETQQPVDIIETQHPVEIVDCQSKPTADLGKCYEGGHTLDEVVKTQMDVTEDTCKYLKDDFGLDKDVVESLQRLYKSVYDGKNNYVYCERIY